MLHETWHEQLVSAYIYINTSSLICKGQVPEPARLDKTEANPKAINTAFAIPSSCPEDPKVVLMFILDASPCAKAEDASNQRRGNGK